MLAIQIGDCHLGAIVNRDLQRRVRSINGIAVHRQVMQNDVRQAAKLIALCDHKEKLFVPEGAEENRMEPTLCVIYVHSV